MSFLKPIFILIIFCSVITSGCSGKDKTSAVPLDFVFVMDARSQHSNTTGKLDVNIKINAKGNGRFEYYDPGGSINYDANGMAIHHANQVVKSGEFHLTASKLERLWDILNKNRFFNLDESYQMELGFSYACIMVEANNQRHIVNNIGMEVPEVRAIVEGVNTIVPTELSLEYGQGFTP